MRTIFFVTLFVLIISFGCLSPSQSKSNICYDSDNGMDIYQQGNVSANYSTGELHSGQDSCYDGLTVDELYCTQSGLYAFKTIPCPENFICKEGTCIKSNDSSFEKKSNYSCMKTDDFGFDNEYRYQYSKGKMTTRYIENGTLKEDIIFDGCVGDSLNETYCSQGFPSSSLHQCQNGYKCIDGKCAREVKGGCYPEYPRISLDYLEVNGSCVSPAPGFKIKLCSEEDVPVNVSFTICAKDTGCGVAPVRFIIPPHDCVLDDGAICRPFGSFTLIDLKYEPANITRCYD